MTDETYERIQRYLARQCADVYPIPVVFDDGVETDRPVLTESPERPEVRISRADYHDLDRRSIEARLDRKAAHG